MNRFGSYKVMLSNFAVFLLLFNVIASIHIHVYDHVPWMYALLAIPFFALILVRRRVGKLAALIVIHLALLALPFLTIGIGGILFWNLMAFAVAGVAYSVLAINLGERPLRVSSVVWKIIVLVVLYFIASFFGVYTAVALHMFSALVLLISVILYTYLDKSQNNLIFLQKSESLTPGSMRVGNRSMTLFLSLVLVFGVLAMVFSNRAFLMVFRGAWLVISRVVLFLASGFVSLLAIFFPEIRQLPEPEGDGLEMDLGYEENYEELEPTTLFYVMGIVISALVAFVVLTAVVSLIVYIIILQKRHKARKREDVTSNNEDTVSKLKPGFEGIGTIFPRLRLGPKNPVRKLFYRKVNQHIKKGTYASAPYHTTDIIADKIRPKENIDELTEKYELARYGRSQR